MRFGGSGYMLFRRASLVFRGTYCRNIMTGMPRVELTARENQICDLLKDYTCEYNELHHPVEPLILRITGGWVRDKLLGQGSHDLDIAINIMTGEQFALGLNDYLSINYDKYGIKPHSIHKIDKNPEKSKHLETTTTKLFDMEIDFVNLRSEEYTELSRIPIVKFGTPQEDALRRDATLNALFYNIQEGTIEDFTQRGLKDLRSGIIRTPLPPRQTFLDDPLRALRLIRFASRFNFTIADNVLTEMGAHEINVAFNSKISRERIGAEMEKILNGPNPNIALHLIQKAHLDNVIFFWHHNKSVMEYNEAHLPNYSQITHIYNDNILNDHLFNFWNEHNAFLDQVPQLKSKLDANSNMKQNYILGTAILPMTGIIVIAMPKKKANNTMSLTECIVREGLKMTKADAILLGQCVDAVTLYDEKVSTFITKGRNALKRSDLGSFIRSFNGNYELAHYISLMNMYLKTTDAAIKQKTIQDYETFYNYIIEQNLQDSHNLKPLIDGKKILGLLKLKSGPWMTKMNDDIIIWQFDNPTGTEDQLLTYITDTIIPKYIN